MNNFLDRFKPQANALQNALKARTSTKFQGSGQTLGDSGKDPHHSVIAIQLSDPGSFGIGIERMKSGGGCVVGKVEDGSQAQRAGIQRGDVICFAGTCGKEEVLYNDFLRLAKSNDRPLCFDVRRAKSSVITKTATSGGKDNKQPQSAEAYAKKQAMIAAAEARDKAHKEKLKPISRVATKGISRTKTPNYDFPDQDPKSDIARAAVEAAKSQEAKLASQLGYNPYETNRSTAGQARTATVVAAHGTIQNNADSEHTTESTLNISLESIPDSNQSIPAEFATALEVLITNSETASESLSILHRLVLNATTKGQQKGADAGKFRKVRLVNPKIVAAVVDPPGALDLLLICGFVLTEEEDETRESILVFPITSTLPDWLPTALNQMKQLASK